MCAVHYSKLNLILCAFAAVFLYFYFVCLFFFKYYFCLFMCDGVAMRLFHRPEIYCFLFWLHSTQSHIGHLVGNSRDLRGHLCNCATQFRNLLRQSFMFHMPIDKVIRKVFFYCTLCVRVRETSKHGNREKERERDLHSGSYPYMSETCTYSL